MSTSTNGAARHRSGFPEKHTCKSVTGAIASAWRFWMNASYDGSALTAAAWECDFHTARKFVFFLIRQRCARWGDFVRLFFFAGELVVAGLTKKPVKVVGLSCSRAPVLCCQPLFPAAAALARAHGTKRRMQKRRLTASRARCSGPRGRGTDPLRIGWWHKTGRLRRLGALVA